MNQSVEFTQDGRKPLNELYSNFSKLSSLYGWDKHLVYSQGTGFDILNFNSPKKGKALWILSGIHGEEPAGPNAISKSIELIGQLGQQIPIVLFPLCNPLGYFQNWRYPNEYRDWKKGISVSDSEFLLLNTDKKSPRTEKPAGEEAFYICGRILELLTDYPPHATIDHHEDEALQYSYIYSHGPDGVTDQVAKEIIEIMKHTGAPLQMEGKTRFDETIENGVVLGLDDGSIDALLSAKEIIVNGLVRPGPNAQSSIVVETPAINVLLSKRVKIHTEIIKNYERLYHL
jgi:hypothetical protein